MGQEVWCYAYVDSRVLRAAHAADIHLAGGVQYARPFSQINILAVIGQSVERGLKY